MRLRSLRRHWERLGRQDPFWAVLTDADKAGGRWSIEEFYRSGEREIAAVLDGARQRGLSVQTLRALDFGCGAGRLTQALAARFDHVDAVDISAPMIELARRHDRHPGKCTYHLNAADNLAILGDASFTFVYSAIVLQHIEPRVSTSYIREFLRVLAPDSLLVFQQPSHRAADEPSSAAIATRSRRRLDRAACQASIAADASPPTLRAGQEVPLRVRVRNASAHVWPALPDESGSLAINLANRWLYDDGAVYRRDDARCPLPYDLKPGAEVEVVLGIHAPTHDGRYRLELDMVQENVGWFASRGSNPHRAVIEVEGGSPAPGRRPAVPPPLPVTPRFSERHPRAFRVLSDTGIRDVYWAARRGWDRVKHQRDRLVWWTTDHVYDRTVPPLVNWWRNRPFAARMEMHCVPRAEIVKLVTANGGRVVDIEGERTPGGYQSYRYWVVKG